MNINRKNWNCDGDTCLHSHGEIRVLPIGGGSNALLCFACYRYEMAFRKERNKKLCEKGKLDLPEWNKLKVYETN